MLISKHESFVHVPAIGAGILNWKHVGIRLTDCVVNFLPFFISRHLEIISPLIILVQKYRLTNGLPIPEYLRIGICRPYAVAIVMVIKLNTDR